MEAKESLSVSEKLLLSACDLEKNGHCPFSAEDLVVSAWRKFPDAFGLAGHRDQNGQLLYPDSNRVFAEIMGSKPIRKRGFLKKVGTKMYQLTEAGHEHARLLLNRTDRSTVKKAALPREIEQELKRLFASKAWAKFRNKRVEDITFYDACAFWGISPRSSAIELEGRTANLMKVIASARNVVGQQKATFDHSGATFGISETDTLTQTHHELLKKFQEEIKIIQERDDERRI